MSMYSLSTVLPGLYGPALALFLWTHYDNSYILILIGVLAVLPLFIMYGAQLPTEKQHNGRFTLREMSSALKDACRNSGLVVSAVVLLTGAQAIVVLVLFSSSFFSKFKGT
ncbi:hypothetical protein DNH61_03680 [Paenibacillus sambharensis]|uniref:Major facilitator superfamily (MFS) profile domain-containing protein n=1 Tax=Paenibacillus sambharensis TaxID=1803190 RepID=A0A2W1LGJ9_9BACL|nr:hypothetical protein [Paenibacillus sambharensis]PZD97190.1 hypothetical protein DNH61_03680 [Paenibacillus sambharensis]